MKQKIFPKSILLTVFVLFLASSVFAENPEKLSRESDGAGTKKHGSYEASQNALNILIEKNDKYQIEKTKNGDYIFTPINNEFSEGFIFYPGGKVEREAYLPLIKAMAEEGYLSVLVHMPFDLAVLDMNAAEDFIKRFPEIKHWILGGHSLGGAMAGAFAASHADSVDGVILLAAYSTKKIDEKLSVLSIYGSCDGVLNFNNYEKDRKNLPADLKEIVIQGGCHSYFGDYGNQAGDGKPEISREKQFSVTISAMKEFFHKFS